MMLRIVFACCTALVATAFLLPAKTPVAGVNLEDATRNTPLLVARQSLQVARSRVVERRYSEAIPALLTTANALAFFETQEVGRHDGLSPHAEDVRQQILDYVIGIETDNNCAVILIDGWLDQIRHWKR